MFNLKIVTIITFKLLYLFILKFLYFFACEVFMLILFVHNNVYISNFAICIVSTDNNYYSYECL